MCTSGAATVLDVVSGRLMLASMPGLLRAGLTRGRTAGSAGDVAGLSGSLSAVFAGPSGVPGRGGADGDPLAGSAADGAQIGG